jgi:hypothetical protein
MRATAPIANAAIIFACNDINLVLIVIFVNL